MKTNILLNICIGLLLTSCATQNDRIETILMECSYESFPDNGEEFRTLISDYENLLVNENILTDNSGKSYRNVLQKIADGNEFDKIPSKLFTDEMQKIGQADIDKAQNCQKLIVKDSALYNISKLKGVELAITKAQNSSDVEVSIIAEDFLKVLSEEDFELDFYKLRTFFLFNIVDLNSGINRKLPEVDGTQIEYDLMNALKISIDNKNEIYINSKKVSISELKKSVREYELKNKSESIISLKADSGTMYQTYIEVQNAIVGEIYHLRNKLAKEKYNKELENLTAEQLSEIKKVYPQKLVE